MNLRPYQALDRATPIKAFIAGCVVMGAICTPAHAVLFVVPAAALSSPNVNSATIVHFDEVALGTAIAGTTIKGFSFSENLANARANNGGPGPSNNIAAPFLLSGSAFDASTYVLGITLPSPATSFGFGFSILETAPRNNVVTLTLFSGATNLGGVGYGASPDPTFDGGFAGIGSTVPFTRVEVTFRPLVIAYAIDNVAVVSASVPEASWSIHLFGLALLGCFGAKTRLYSKRGTGGGI